MSEAVEQRLRLAGLALEPAPMVEAAALAATLAGMPASRARQRKLRLLAAAVVLLPLAIGLGLWASGSSDPEQPAVVAGESSDRWPSETLTDVVSYADQVSVVTVLSEEQLPLDPEDAAIGEGYVGRSVVLRIDRTVWEREAAPRVAGEIEIIPWGWLLQDDRLIPFGSWGAPRLEVGRQYMLPLVRAPRDSVEWSALSDSSSLPFDGERITTDGVLGGQPSFLLEEVAGLTPEELGIRLARTPPDPLAYKYRHLDPDERVERVFGEN